MKAQALSVLRPTPVTNDNTNKLNTTTNSKKSSLLLKVLADSGNRHAKIDATKVKDAGGGPGHQNLNFSELQEKQKMMYKRTLNDAQIFQDNRSQETRQLKIYDEPIIITVNVAREDFPAISADFTCSYVISAPQSGWARFLSDVKTKLELEFIECIVDRVDGAPVFRMLTLRNGGNYFVRQRESSSILEILSTNQAPQTYIWPVTKDIAAVQEELAHDVKTFPKTDAKIDSLILRPLVRPQERDAALALLSSTTVDDIICIIDEVMHSVVVEEEKKESDEHNGEEDDEQNDEGDDDDDADGDKDETKSSPDNEKEEIKPVEVKKTYDKNVDIINLHRIALESFSRFVLQGPKRALQVVEEGLQFVFDTLKVLNNEVDLIVMGFRLISELAPWLGPKKKEVIVCLLDCIQFYSPPSPVHRPRQIPRNNIKPIKSNMLKLLGADEEEDEDSGDGVKKLTLAERMAKRLGTDKLVNEEVLPEPVPEPEPEREMKVKIRRTDANRPLKPVKVMSLSKGFVGKVRPPRTKEEIEEERIAKSKEEDYLRQQRELMDPTTEAEKLARKAALREKFAKLPPVAAPPAFRCFSKSNYPNAYALTQCYVTFFKLMTQHAIFRVQAFELNAHDEICYIALECGSLPRVLEYTVWIINEIYRDGVQLNDDDDVESIDATMAASSLQSNADGDADDNRDVQSIDPYTGFIIEAVSTITTPSLDSQLGFHELTPRVNMGDPNEKTKKDKKVMNPKALKHKYRGGDTKSNMTGKDIDESVYYDPDDKIESDSDSDSDREDRENDAVGAEKIVENINNDDGENEELKEDDKKDLDEEDYNPAPAKASAPVRSNRAALLMPSTVIMKAPKTEMKSGEQGEEEATEEVSEDALRQQKYRAIPADVIVVALAMISTHVDLASDSKEMAMKWLGVWDDASPHFRALRTKGNNISGM